MSDKPKGLLWLDLETGGLDPAPHMATGCALLEVAAVAARSFLDPFAVVPVVDAPVKISLEGAAPNNAHVAVREGIFSTRVVDDFCWKLHTDNGLLKACQGERALSVHAIEEMLLSTVGEEPRESRWVLAGSTVHFDRSFLRVWMPRLEARLSHRHYDVSAVKLFCQSLGMTPFPKVEAHRAWEDVHESIRHAQGCRRWLRENFEPRLIPVDDPLDLPCNCGTSARPSHPLYDALHDPSCPKYQPGPGPRDPTH